MIDSFTQEPALDAIYRGDLRAIGGWLAHADHGLRELGIRIQQLCGVRSHPVVSQRHEVVFEPRRLLRELSVLGVRVALLRTDRHELRIHERELSRLGREDARAAAYAAAARGYLAWLEQRFSDVREEVAALECNRDVAAQADLKIEIAVLDSLSTLDDGRALLSARRAVRMAYTEQLWMSHFWASYVLARTRRRAGTPELTVGIASACLERTGALWHPWFAWEMLLAGDLDARVMSSTVSPFAETLRRIGAIPFEEPRLIWPDASSAAPDSSGLVPVFDAEWQEVLTLFGARSPASPRGEVARWLRGETPLVPRHFAGFTSQPLGAPRRAMALALAGNDCHGIRVLRCSVPEGIEMLSDLQAGLGRVDALLASLFLTSPDSRPVNEAFRDVFGFVYREELHESTFKVLRHRARKRAAKVGNFRYRLGEGYVFEAVVSAAVADPRCAGELSHVLMRHLAKRGSMAAKDLSEQLDVPLRTVQAVLKRLVEDGACEQQRDGRNVHYALEDTTFCTLTVA